MDLKLLRLMLFLVIGVTSAGYAESMESQNSPTILTAEQSQLDKARQRNEEAQADYYQEQANRLRNPGPRKTLWQNISDNPASALGVLGAVIVALVTLISFLLNYRVSLNNQMDIQFYEALKRFGDKDSPAVRFSAAAILSQIAGYGRRKFQLRHPVESLRNPRRIYFATTRNQLAAGLMLEENIVALLSIRDALSELVRIDARQTVEWVFRANQRTLTDGLIAIVQFCSTYGARTVSEIDDSQWRQAASIAEHFESEVLKQILNSKQQRAERVFASHLLAYEAIPPEQRGEYRLQNQRNLQTTFFRLRMIVYIYSGAFIAYPLSDFTKECGPLFLVHSYLVKANLEAANLAEALMFAANIRHANLMHANLAGTWLRNADLFATKLWNAGISERTDLGGTNWWQANYFGKKEGEIDSQLLEALFDRYGGVVPSDREQLHPSVRGFLAERRNASD